jgi:hypothetical protein
MSSRGLAGLTASQETAAPDRMFQLEPLANIVRRQCDYGVKAARCRRRLRSGARSVAAFARRQGEFERVAGMHGPRTLDVSFIS